MHSPTPEPAKAGFSRSRGVSTAEKRAEYARLGMEWPKYPDGTDMQWSPYAAPCGGYWRRYESAQRSRVRAKAKNAMLVPGECGAAGCSNPRHEMRSGKYERYCLAHKRGFQRQYRRKQLGWYDEGGMATKPTQFKELTK